MEFRIVDTAHEATRTWAVEDAHRIIGKISQMATTGRYRITDAGAYCRPPRGDHASISEAARALTSARADCKALRVDASGLMQIERDVLDFEGSHTAEPGSDERQREAVQLGISPTLYHQIVRRMRLDTRAEARSPRTVQRLCEWHQASLDRTSRLRRMAPAALAQAS